MYEDFFIFAFMVMIISVTGVMSPGPLFVANIAHGIKGGMKSGFKMAVGHTIVEIPIVVAFGLGIIVIDGTLWFKAGITIVGAIGLFVFVAIQMKSVMCYSIKERVFGNSPLITGMVLSFLNPLFILWWGTIGLKLITDANQWGLIGISTMFALHIWMDYAWMMFVGGMSGKASKFITNKVYKMIMIGTSIILVYFGIMFVADAMTHFT